MADRPIYYDFDPTIPFEDWYAQREAEFRAAWEASERPVGRPAVDPAPEAPRRPRGRPRKLTAAPAPKGKIGRPRITTGSQADLDRRAHWRALKR